LWAIFGILVLFLRWIPGFFASQDRVPLEKTLKNGFSCCYRRSLSLIFWLVEAGTEEVGCISEAIAGSWRCMS
jgi:hypothetical protein